MGQLPAPAFSLGRQGMVQLVGGREEVVGGPGERHEGQWRQQRGWGVENARERLAGAGRRESTWAQG